MASSRSVRSAFDLAKRARISSSPRAAVQTFLRAESTNSNAPTEPPKTAKQNAGERKVEKGEPYDPMKDPKRAPLHRQLTDLGVDPVEYETIRADEEKVRARARPPPKNKEEAMQRWEEFKKAPDNYNMLSMWKRAGVEPISLAKERGITLPEGEKAPLDPKTQKQLSALRDPINVQAVKMRPLRRAAPYGVPVCDLQLRTYSTRNILLFTDFAVRAAYYFGLPCKGPIPLPRITERWTVPRANFIFKKSQENFERITIRRLIQIQDGHPDVVKMWLAFLQKHQYHGVGMKANIWEFESLEEALRSEERIEVGQKEGRKTEPMLKKVEEILAQDGFREAMQGFNAPAVPAP